VSENEVWGKKERSNRVIYRGSGGAGSVLGRRCREHNEPRAVFVIGARGVIKTIIPKKF